MQQVRYFRPDGLDNPFRENRFRLFRQLLAQVLREKKFCRILDVGGVEECWSRFGNELDWSRIEACVANVTASPTKTPGLTAVIGDDRRLDQFADLSDIVHSNSVIEHVGRWDDMSAMAREVHRLAPHYFIQTPYFWFPIEPHARFPMLHWMPESWRYRIIMKRTCGFWQRQPDVGSAVRAIQSANMLDKRQMKFLFPDAKIVVERFFGLPKSLIAIC